MGASVTDSVDVATRHAGQSLHVADEMSGQHAEVSSQCIREVRKVVVVAGMQHQHEWYADPVDTAQPPVFVEPDPAVALVA